MEIGIVGNGTDERIIGKSKYERPNQKEEQWPQRKQVYERF